MNLEIPGGGKHLPYIQFDLDAKKLVPRIAKAAGTHSGKVAWGLMELWEHVWTTKKDVVTGMVLDGCFGPNGRIRTALIEHGFIEPVETGWRVRGAKQRLFGQEKRGSAGGLATAISRKSLANLKQNRPKTRSEARSDSLGHEPGETCSDMLGLNNTERNRAKPNESKSCSDSLGVVRTELTEADTEAHPAPNTQHPIKKPPPALTRDEKPVGFLRDQIDAVFLASKGATYDWSFEDERAISPLQAKAGDVGDEEILRRWKIGLGLRFPITSKVSVLLRNWNECAKDQPAPVNPFPQRTGRATESDKDWSKKPKTYVSKFGEELDLEVCDG